MFYNNAFYSCRKSENRLFYEYLCVIKKKKTLRQLGVKTLLSNKKNCYLSDSSCDINKGQM